MRVLIVDDDRAIRDLLVALLQFEGWEVVVAEDGGAGLDAVARARPDVVLVDVTRPGMSGAELCRRLKGGVAPPRVVMLTGRSMSQLGHHRVGPDVHLRKPFSPVQLLEAVGAGAGGGS